jgi:DNA repair protein RecN (Recombination protein N)
MLDAFAGAGDLASQVAETYQAWKRAALEYDELDRGAHEKLRLADLWSFQREEIEAVAPKPGEDAQLENERRVLRNVVRLQELAGGAYATLYEDPGSAAAQVGSIAKRLEELGRIDQSAQELLAQLQPATIALQETAHSLRHYLGKLDADPGRLDEVEDRLAALDKLKRKYGPSAEQMLQFLEEVRANLAGVETADDRRNTLQKAVAELAQTYETLAQQLSARRKEAAGQLGKRVEQELAALAMEKTRVVIRVVTNMDPAEWSERGADTVVFLIAPNVGEELKPLDKIASGGELSRVALALKTCVTSPDMAAKTAKSASPRTLVFDEVDAGVGGSAAEAVGRRLKKLSGANQVICVTHLPQIAGFADHHYFVEKHSEHGRTIATIEELASEARTREIGRMLSGERITQEALRHAEQLLKIAAK